MRILLDTHILLWALADDSRLPEKARALIEKEENEIYYSIVTPWEVEIKHLAHPDAMQLSAGELVKYCKEADFFMLPIREKHIFALVGLTRKENVPPHKDPFDRMLICQASTESMAFLTHDALIAGYADPCIVMV